MISRLLIANRGEIAVRIIHACREMSVSPIAIYSEADRDAPQVALADSAYLIGPSPATESYLCVDRILEAANRAEADAIHPGYGFLSESAEFAEACEAAGLTFVGPTPESMRLLGDKIAARRLMAEAGVPVVPGYAEEDTSAARLRSEAARIGFPLLVKAAAGGGGRGMRPVLDASELPGAVAEARREAESAFGDGRLYLEHMVQRPHHVEFQVFGDQHGNVVHLFERDCSIQRRHQKIVEESPSPILDPDTRAAMADAAVRAAQAAGYSNAGTVEFLVEVQPDGARDFYFLEVNARLQVEHPVTELRTGIDLVKLQIRTAAGESLPFRQEDIEPRGYAIEVRIYAEDPEAGFAPSIGRIEQWIPPTAPWVRVDSGVERGSVVSPYYDPMLAKLVVWGACREEAVDRLARSLEDFHVLGVRTNISYLLAIARSQEFRAGRTHTGFLHEQLPAWHPPAETPEEALLALAAEAVTRGITAPASPGHGTGDPYSPWRSLAGWRNA